MGIGAATAVFSVVYSLVLRPPDVAEVDRVVSLYHSQGSGPPIAFSWSDLEELRSRQESFASVGAWARFASGLELPGGAKPILGELVDPGYFEVLRVSPEQGRLIQHHDNIAGAPPVIVLSHSLWATGFGGDPGVVGTAVRLGGSEFTVVGVAPRSARGVDLPNLSPTAAWIPIRQRHLIRGLTAQQREQGDSELRWVRSIGRLANGRSLAHANLELRTIGMALDLASPIGSRLDPRFRTSYATERLWFARRMAGVRVHESVERLVNPAVLAVFLATALVLMVTLLNLANLLFARALDRQGEFAIRCVVGASRARVVLEQTAEFALLAFFGFAFSLLVAQGLLSAMTSEVTIGDTVAVVVSIRPELTGNSVLVALAATFLALLIAGFLPAWFATRGNLWTTLAGGAVSGLAVRWRGRRWLIGIQVTVCVAILVFAFVAAAKARQIGGADPGLDMKGLAFATTVPSATGIASGTATEALLHAAERAAGYADVVNTAVATALPVGAGESIVTVGSTESQASNIGLRLVEASPGFPSLLGWPLVAGRDFSSEDHREARPVALITKRAAAQLFGVLEPVGRVVAFRRAPEWEREIPIERQASVVGLLDDVHDNASQASERGVIVLPLSKDTPNQRLMLLVRSRSPDLAALQLRSAISDVAPELTVSAVGTGSTLAEGVTFVLRVIASAAGLLGAFALGVALVGIYGVLTFVVSRRRREMGIRLALGAGGSQLRMMVLVDGLVPVLAGLVTGTVLVTPVLLSPWAKAIVQVDGDATASVALALASIALASLIAIWVPANSASRVAPSLALRVK